MYNQAGLPPGGPPGPPGGSPLGVGVSQASLEMGRAMVEQQARALQAAQREAEAREKLVSKSHSPEVITPASRLQSTPNKSTEDSSAKSGRSKDSEKSRDPEEEDDEDMSPPPMKRERVDSFDHRNGSPLMSGANIRIANRGSNEIHLEYYIHHIVWANIFYTFLFSSCRWIWRQLFSSFIGN